MNGQTQVTDQITEIVPRMRREKLVLCYPRKWNSVNQTGTVWVALGGDTPQVERGINLEPGGQIVLDELSHLYEVDAVSGIKASGSSWVTWSAPRGVEL